MSDASPPSTYITKGEMIGVRRDPMKAAPNAVKTTGRLAIEFLQCNIYWKILESVFTRVQG